MSDVKRYDRNLIDGTLCVSDCGKFVKWEDYARLQAEVERLNRLKKGNDALLAVELYNNMYKDEKAANARLKAEVKRLGIEHISDLGMLGESCAENARLKAEVERLRASSFVTAVPVEQYERLKAEVERLRKAGDAILWDGWGLSFDQWQDACEKWNAAKEGKPTK